MYEKYNFGGLKVPTDVANNFTFESHVRAFMYLVTFHKSGLINRDSLVALLGNLRSGKLLRWVKTYHCPMNKKWYHDEPILSVYEELYRTHMVVAEVTMQELLMYVNLYLNLPMRSAFGWVAYELINPLIDELDVVKLKEFGLDEPGCYVSYDMYRTSGYCCSDCDGNFDDYKSHRYKYYVENPTKEQYWEVIRGLRKKLAEK